MEENLFPVCPPTEDLLPRLRKSNEAAARYGLALSGEAMETLVKSRPRALREAGRVEFGSGILDQMILAFCDSPYLDKENFEPVLEELQMIFYHFKNETEWPDDALLKAMAAVFNGRAGGSAAYLSGLTPQELRDTAAGRTEEESL
ncbi:MAG: hypothetical protein GXW99_11125 [Clostridiales bacterium]|nr:hypothetical protein [Clostridiales bacterium]